MGDEARRAKASLEAIVRLTKETIDREAAGMQPHLGNPYAVLEHAKDALQAIEKLAQ